jgi:hypothetical protein
VEQEGLDGIGPQPAKRRTGDTVYKRFLDTDGTILLSAWLRACNNGESVGTCRECGGDLVPDRPVGRADGGSTPDYPMVCANVPACGKEVVAPRGRTSRWNGERAKRRPLGRGLTEIAKAAAGPNVAGD